MKQQPSPADAALLLARYLCLNHTPQKSDVIFILGGNTATPIHRAAELFYAGFAPKIAFISTGGNFGGQLVFGMEEHLMYKKVLIEEHSVPPDAILCDGRTTNTLVEAMGSVPFLAEHGIRPASMLLVARAVHSRRAYATFCKQQPNVRFTSCPGLEPLDVNNRDQLQRVVDECSRLEQYAAKGDIVFQPFPEELVTPLAVVRGTLS